MAATVVIIELNGAAPGTPTTKSGGVTRFKNADDATVDTADPLVIPSSGQEYSFQKWLAFSMVGTRPTDNISNLEVYMDGANGFGTGVLLWLTTSSAYVQPVVPTEANDPPIQSFSSTVTMTDAFAFTSGSPRVLNAGGISVTATVVGSLAVFVMEINQTASPGLTNSETITFEYDEI